MSGSNEYWPRLRIGRRELLTGFVGLGAFSALSKLDAPAHASCRSTVGPGFGTRESDRIRAENDREGTLDWQLTVMRTDPKSGNFRSRLIEGYASKMSVRAGESIDLVVSTEPASPFEIDIFRMGYYQGLGGRHIMHLGPFNGRTQPTPPVADERLRECEWEPAVSLKIPNDWTSGVYLAKLTRLSESSNPKSQVHQYES